MKTRTIVLSILGLLFTIVRWGMWIDENQKEKAKEEFNEKMQEFVKGTQLLDSNIAILLKYPECGADSINCLSKRLIASRIPLDSCVKFYTDNMPQKDVNNYYAKLELLYEYMKLTYIFDDWIAYNRNNKLTPKTNKEFIRQYNEYSRQRSNMINGIKEDFSFMLLFPDMNSSTTPFQRQ